MLALSMEDLAFNSPDGELMVMTVPNEFIVAVSRISESRFENVAQEWKSIELMGEWPVSEIKSVLNDLSEICKTALSENKPVLQVASL